MKKLIFIPLLLIILGACSQQEDVALDSPKSTVKEPYTGVAHDVWVNVLTERFGGYTKGKLNTRAEGEFTITPYIEDGDTLMYIVQYQEGWELYSASKATNMRIFSSEEGKFDINNPNMPEAMRTLIKLNCEKIKEAKLYSVSDIDHSWTIETDKSNLNQGIAIAKKNGVEKIV